LTGLRDRSILKRQITFERILLMRDSTVSPASLVMVIEDDPSIAGELCALLEPRGYQVVVTGPRQALSAVGAIEGPCVVLLDPLARGVTANGLAGALRDGQTMITLAVAIYPLDGQAPPPSPLDDPRRARRLVSPELLLDLVRRSFGEQRARPAEAALPRAA
jgi:hypothetical protein